MMPAMLTRLLARFGRLTALAFVLGLLASAVAGPSWAHPPAPQPEMAAAHHHDLGHDGDHGEMDHGKAKGECHCTSTACSPAIAPKPGAAGAPLPPADRELPAGLHAAPLADVSPPAEPPRA